LNQQFIEQPLALYPNTRLSWDW